MATPNDDKELRFNAKYLCKSCKEMWKKRNTSHLKQICTKPDCRKLVRAYNFEVIDKLVTYSCPNCGGQVKEKKCTSEVNDVPFCKICGPNYMMEITNSKDLWKIQRKFGTYYCEDCGRTWMSGNSWKGVGQQCRKCQAMFLPHTLEPLQHSVHYEPGIYKPPHEQSLCAKCKELGYNCEEYTPTAEVATEDEIPSDDEDNTSVLSTNSDQIGEEDNNITPVNSDDDDSSDKDDLEIEMSELKIEDN